MNSWFVKYGFLMLILVGLDTATYSQSKTQRLKAQEKRLKKQLAETQELLNASKKSQQNTIGELRIINNQIAVKEELLLNMNNQIKETSSQIKKNKEQLDQLNKDLERLKAEFKEMIRYAYKNRKKENNVIYMFSSKSYSQAYRRMKYMEHYSENRKKKAVEIDKLQNDLTKKNLELASNIESKRELIASFDQEKKQFLEVKAQQQLVLNKIQANKQSLESKLAKQREEQDRVREAIRKEIEKQFAKNKKNKGFKLSPEAKLASSVFEKNKGKLPWPVVKGTITKRFGKQRHSQVSSAFIENNGIDISTTKGANVRVVFNGTVTAIFPIAGSGQAVIVSHGAYRTVYSNLKTVNVKLNQKLKTKDKIGTLLPNSSGAISEAHFEIWKFSGTTQKKQNPAIWLYRR
ncbi:MAG: murein hydrolase activator EnvC family protein [Flavobacteriales bacterium]